MTDRFYITTTIPYVNGPPHVGHALELVQADAFARYQRLVGSDVRLQTGTDENALKNVLTAREQGIPIERFVDENTGRFATLCEVLGISHDRFIRTSEDLHRQGVNRLWARLRGDDLYRRNYSALYCVGCEDFLRERDLVDGNCLEHGQAPVPVSEENWFFRLSRYQVEIENLIRSDRLAIIPEKRKREVLRFVEQGLQDISVSRSAEKYAGWGIPVPGDPAQVIYVWIDALMNYLSGLEFGGGDWESVWNSETRKSHLIGKNVWKFHAIYWPALLLSANLPLPDEIIVHGFLTENGRKISKSHGFTIDPIDCVQDFGVEAVRYYLLRAIPSFQDGDFSVDRLKTLYNTDLANGLGNLVSRVTRLCERAEYGSWKGSGAPPAPEGYVEAIETWRFDRALATLMDGVSGINRDIEMERPWEQLVGDREGLHSNLTGWLDSLHGIAHWIQPFLPNTANAICEGFASDRITAFPPLFPRLG